MDALKGEPFTPQIFPLFLDAFKVLLQANFNGESSRSLSLFVTYALHDNRASYVKRPLRSKTSALRLRRVTPTTLTPGATPRSASPGQNLTSPAGLPLAELGISVLGLLAELLCDPSNSIEIVRFAKNVTGKVRFCVTHSPDCADFSSGSCTCLRNQTNVSLCLLPRF